MLPQFSVLLPVDALEKITSVKLLVSASGNSKITELNRLSMLFTPLQQLPNVGKGALPLLLPLLLLLLTAALVGVSVTSPTSTTGLDGTFKDITDDDKSSRFTFVHPGAKDMIFMMPQGGRQVCAAAMFVTDTNYPSKWTLSLSADGGGTYTKMSEHTIVKADRDAEGRFIYKVFASCLLATHAKLALGPTGDGSTMLQVNQLLLF